MVTDRQTFPIVQAGTPQVVIGSREAESAYQVERTFSKNTKASDVAAVLRNFRLNEDDVLRT